MKIIILILCVLPFVVQSAPLKLCQESASEDPGLPLHVIEGRSYSGHHAAIVAQALVQLKTEFTLERLPWKRCVSLVEKGVYDGAIGMGWSIDRSQKFAFPAGDNNSASAPFRISNIRYSIYTNVHSQLTWDGVHFEHVKIGIAAPKGYLVEEQLRVMKLLQETDVGGESWLTLLKRKRVDGIVLTESIGDQLMAEDGNGEIRKLELPFYQQPVFLVFSLRQTKLSHEQIDVVWNKVAAIRDLFLILDDSGKEAKGQEPL